MRTASTTLCILLLAITSTFASAENVFFKNVDVELTSGRSCKCSFSLDPTGNVMNSRGNCDKRCTGSAKGVELIGQNQVFKVKITFTFTIQFKVKKGRVALKSIEVSTTPPTPSINVTMLTTTCSDCSSGTCLGLCPFDAICLGLCVPVLPGTSYDDACLAVASKLTLDPAKCSSDCPDGGEEACQTCLATNIPEECKTEISFGCISCVISIVEAAYKCYMEYAPNWFEVAYCMYEYVPERCYHCVPKIAPKAYPQLSEFSEFSAGSLSCEKKGQKIIGTVVGPLYFDIVNPLECGAICSIATNYCGAWIHTGSTCTLLNTNDGVDFDPKYVSGDAGCPTIDFEPNDPPCQMEGKKIIGPIRRTINGITSFSLCGVICTIDSRGCKYWTLEDTTCTLYSARSGIRNANAISGASTCPPFKLLNP